MGTWCSDSLHGIFPVRVEDYTGHADLSFKVSFSMANTWALCSSCAQAGLNPISVCASEPYAEIQSLSAVQNTQNIINIWSGFHQSRTCALQFYLSWNFQVHIDHLERALVRLCLGKDYSIEDLARPCCLFMLGQCYSAAWAVIWSKEGNGETRPFASWIPILQLYITLILVSALQQDESGRYLALFLSHHHNAMVDLAGWNEDFHLLLPLMSLSEASNSHAPCGCSGLFFREWKTVPSSGQWIELKVKLQVFCPWMREEIFGLALNLVVRKLHKLNTEVFGRCCVSITFGGGMGAWECKFETLHLEFKLYALWQQWYLNSLPLSATLFHFLLHF